VGLHFVGPQGLLVAHRVEEPGGRVYPLYYLLLFQCNCSVAQIHGEVILCAGYFGFISLNCMYICRVPVFRDGVPVSRYDISAHISVMVYLLLEMMCM
jgi:hypothetical protein